MQSCHRNILYVITYAHTIHQPMVTPPWLSPEILKQVQTEFNPMLGYKLASFHLQIQKGPVLCMWLKNQTGLIALW